MKEPKIGRNLIVAFLVMFLGIIVAVWGTRNSPQHIGSTGEFWSELSRTSIGGLVLFGASLWWLVRTIKKMTEYSDRERRRQELREKLTKTFGVTKLRGECDILEVITNQVKIEALLKERAKIYLKSCALAIEAREKLETQKDNSELQRRFKEAEFIRRGYYPEFWDLHKLAQEAGYYVEERAGDYLELGSVPCEVVQLLLALGGYRLSIEGRAKLDRHLRNCKACSSPGEFQSDLDAHVERTPEIEQELEEAFGPIRWAR